MVQHPSDSARRSKRGETPAVWDGAGRKSKKYDSLVVEHPKARDARSTRGTSAVLEPVSYFMRSALAFLSPSP